MPTQHAVSNGECIHSIAEQYGFFWETLWEHANNSELKKKRKDPNILMDGDVVYVPDLTAKEESGAANQKHKFKRKGVPAQFSLRLMEDVPPEATQKPPASTINPSGKHISGEDPEPANAEIKQQPRKNVPFRAIVGAQTIEGNTDGDGILKIAIPPGAREMKILVEPGTPKETELQINLGHLDPVDVPSGVLKRLSNLGYDCGGATDLQDPGVCAAIQAFQKQHKLTVSGEVDQATRDKLVEIHGS
jgi:hypothetical protein